MARAGQRVVRLLAGAASLTTKQSLAPDGRIYDEDDLGPILPPGEAPMPPLKQILAGEVSPEELAFRQRLDDLDRIRRWRAATLEERGRAIAGLLDLVWSMGRFPPKHAEFPGFPGSHRRPKGEP
jgi:hypothetical protein